MHLHIYTALYTYSQYNSNDLFFPIAVTCIFKIIEVKLYVQFVFICPKISLICIKPNVLYYAILVWNSSQT